MFKSGRWRSEKNKIKVLFKLQFHAAQMTQVAADALMVSVVPADVGKPTVKSDKSALRDGSCFWENPVYETVKFNRDSKSGKILERTYYFVVGTGSAKAGIIGEATIDFSSYADSTKVSLASLPLKNSKTEAVLHVSIQRIHDSSDQREVEERECDNISSKDHSLRSHLGSNDADVSAEGNYVQESPLNKSVSRISPFNGIRRASTMSDITISSSESGSVVETPWEPQIKSENVEACTDDSSNTPRETFLSHHSGETSDIIEKLKAEIAVLSRQAEMSELELQTLRKQIVKESKKGQDLFKEFACLKEERDSLKSESEKRKAESRRVFQFEGGDSSAIAEELRQELNHAKELNANLQIQLQKTQESNNELILAVHDLDEMLERKNAENISVSRIFDENNDDEEQTALEELVKEHSDSKDAYLLEQQIMDLHSEIEIYKRDKDELEMQMEQLALDYEIMKQENHDISYRLEQSQIQEQLKMQYECSSTYNGHELESQIESLENELKTQSKEFADSLLRISELETQVKSLKEEEEKQAQSRNELELQTESRENELKCQSKELADSFLRISELEAHVKTLEEEIEKQAHGFEADLENFTALKIEQEQRAIRAEESLRKTRWQNANTAERLQDEFRRLSVQMTSTFEANEKLAGKAMAEANELRLQKSYLEETIRKASEEQLVVNEHYEARLHQLASQVILMTHQIEELENQKKNGEEARKLLSDEISMLKDEIESCMAKNTILLEKVAGKETMMHELAQMRIKVKEMELLVEQGNDERFELESKVLVIKNEAEESRKEFHKMRCLFEEKQSEVDSLQSHCTEMKRSLSEGDSEKEILKKQVSQLKVELKKKEDMMKTTSKAGKPLSRGSKEVTSLKERIKLLEGQIKIKESNLETSTNAFLEKEKDLHDKIDQLEDRMEVLNQTSAQYCENNIKKDGDIKELINEMGVIKEKNRTMEEELKEMQGRYSEISLKFAEVEGERQKLVMKLRNSKKN